ncbi:hypothetical protein SUGI_1143440 [Cryptomeria japonica]|nr:hypothetical protein SUGI_1143440 [Cryptomeria japonica]
MKKALGAKLSWRIYAEGFRQWSKLLQAKYLGNNMENLFSDALPMGSSIWNFLKACDVLISSDIRWKLGNGSKIRFWRDGYLDLVAFKDQQCQPSACNLLWVGHFEVVVSTRDTEDRRVWGFKGNGGVSSKEAYDFYFSCSGEDLSTRNRRVFSDKEKSVERVWDLVEIGEGLNDKIRGISVCELGASRDWGAVKSNPNKAGGGGIFRDWQGQPVDLFAVDCNLETKNMAKACAL